MIALLGKNFNGFLHLCDQDIVSTPNSAYNEVTFNEKSAVMKENLHTKYFHLPITMSTLTKSHL